MNAHAFRKPNCGTWLPRPSLFRARNC
jgi:hypothetical protein